MPSSHKYIFEPSFQHRVSFLPGFLFIFLCIPIVFFNLYFEVQFLSTLPFFVVDDVCSLVCQMKGVLPATKSQLVNKNIFQGNFHILCTLLGLYILHLVPYQFSKRIQCMEFPTITIILEIPPIVSHLSHHQRIPNSVLVIKQDRNTSPWIVEIVTLDQ